MSSVNAFLGGAKSRLLPASVPFRYFAAAALFHLLAWLAAGLGAEQLTSFRGGLGWPLAALHAVTLGVLLMTAIGASVQLLPVATRQPVFSAAAPALLWWLYAPAVALLVAAMAWMMTTLMALAAAGIGVVLLAWAALLARNLLGARGMPVVVGHGWVALVSLLVLMASAASLALMYIGEPAWLRGTAITLHLGFGAYGFMALLILGFSYILVPMFALADTPAETPSLQSWSLAIAALTLVALGVDDRLAPVSLPLAVLCGLAALGVHVVLMRRALRSGLRRDLGSPFVLVHLGWVGLAASLVLAFDLSLAAPLLAFERSGTLFGVLLVMSLLSFVLGMLVRIVPFLASMHAAPGRRGPPLPSALSAERPLTLFYRCHYLALATLLAAVGLDSPWLVRAAALAGVTGAAAFGIFVATAWQRMRRGSAVARTHLR